MNLLKILHRRRLEAPERGLPVFLKRGQSPALNPPCQGFFHALIQLIKAARVFGQGRADKSQQQHIQGGQAGGRWLLAPAAAAKLARITENSPRAMMVKATRKERRVVYPARRAAIKPAMMLPSTVAATNSRAGFHTLAKPGNQCSCRR